MSCNNYRPDLLGADCANCPLGPEHNPAGWNPVPPEIHPGNAVAAIGEAPGAEEEIELRPFVGKSGKFWEQLLHTLGIQREQVDLFNTIACRPPGNEFKILETKTRKLNKQRIKDGLLPLKTPMEACAPRLAAEIANYPFGILLGNAPTKSILGIDSGILSARGVMREVNGRKFMPTVHPAFVLRSPHYTPVAVSDLRRAFRGFNGTLYWPQDRRTYLFGKRGPGKRSPAVELYEWFLEAERNGYTQFSYDVETDGKEPLRCNLRTIAITYLHNTVAAHGPCSECHGTGVLVEPGLDKETRIRVGYTWAAQACEVLQGKTSTATIRDALLGQNRPFVSCAACNGQGWKHFETDITCMAIPILDPDGTTRYHTEEEEKQLYQVLAWAFERYGWIGFNAGSYDLMVMVRHCGTAPGFNRNNLLDAILLAPMNNAELSKALGVWGTIFTDVSSSWKADNEGKKLSVAARTLMDLLPYNCTDSNVTNRIALPMWQNATQRGQIRILPEYLKPPEWDDNRPFTLYEINRCAQEFCVDMHATGMFIDQEARAEEEASLTIEADRLRNELREIAHANGYPIEGTTKKPQYFNPASGPQVARLLYEIGDLLPVAYTDMDDPSVDDDALLEHLRDFTGLEAWIRKFILKERAFRRVSKMLSTYVKPLRGDAEKEKDGEGYFIWEDGRVRASWAAHITNVGRLSCSGPNLTNVRKYYKRMYTAAPGHILVGCDLDQAHLRIVANAWEIPLFLEGFIEGIDPHGRYATWIFGEDEYKNAQGWAEVGGYSPKKKPYKGSNADKMRQVAKVGIYLFIYIGSADTAYQQFLATEDSKGRLIYLEEDENGKMPEPLEPGFVEDMREKLMKREPAFEKRAWPDIRKRHKREGFLTDYLFGRRSDVLTFKANEEVNFPVLATEASLMRIVECRVRKYFPREAWGPGTGIINQCHDSITVEVPIELAEWARDTLLTCFTTQIPGWPVPFTAEADIGWFVDERGRVSGGEAYEILDRDGKPFGKNGKGRKYRTDFNGALKSRWSNT